MLLLMIAVIIAGGSGTRLWPLSTPDYPKHLLTINNDKSSLLQQTYDRARRLTDTIYVIPEVGHLKYVQEQLPDLPKERFIVEPGRRGTANCVVTALATIAKRHDKDEPIAFMHADHYIRDINGFVNSFNLAASVTAKEKRIVLVGIEPDAPSTGFGYIEKGDLLNDTIFVYNVNSFKEKPDHQTARKYVSSGQHLWNGGFFVASIATFLYAMTRYAPELKDRYDQLSKAGKNLKAVYLALDNEAIDYALIEKVPDLLVVPANFDWMDLGSFQDLARAAGSDEKGNHLTGDVHTAEVENSYIHNTGDKPVVAIGLDNIVIVNSPKGLLIVRKDLSQKVGDISKQLPND